MTRLLAALLLICTTSVLFIDGKLVVCMVCTDQDTSTVVACGQ